MNRAPLFRKRYTIDLSAGLLTFLGISLLVFPPSVVAEQGVSSLAAYPSTAFMNTPTSISFRAVIPSDPALITTSPNLLRLTGDRWTNVGRMYDDGTHGDAAAGDNVYTAQVLVNEPQVSTLSFRASVAYRGQLKRLFSSTIGVYVAPPLGLKSQAGADFITVMQTESQNVATVISVFNATAGTVNITNSASIAPDNGGVSITSDYPGSGYSASASTSFILNQSFVGNVPGQYLVTNTATIQGTSPALTATSVVVVNVVPPGGDPIINPLGSVPDGVERGVTTEVMFTASIAKFFVPPNQLSLQRVDGLLNPTVGILRDDGSNGDLQAGDGVYTGKALVSESTEGEVRFRASGSFPGVTGDRLSGDFSLVVSCFPTALEPSDYSRIVTDPISNQSFLTNEILVKFVQGTSCAEREALATSVGAVIAGTVPGLGLHQLAITDTGSQAGVLLAISTISASPLVVEAKPNFVGVQPTEVIPSDPGINIGPAPQYGPQKIRADEAWVIARGSPIIGVVDTGVNYNHEDLIGKVILGADLIDGDADPMDVQNHGTHVAGTAAAKTNNGVGIAGISWNSKILAIRGLEGTYAALAAAIKSAADNGAKVINISGGGPDNDSDVEAAVDYAVGKGALVVAAAGNLDTISPEDLFYPCAYANVLCVGYTNSSDNRGSLSNYGAFVDIAAPGELIYATVNTGTGYTFMTGTSMAAPHVSGAAAVVWSRFPSWTAAQVRARLENTAVPLSSGLKLGKGRLDLFEAVFNGSFEDSVTGWDVTGTAGSIPSLSLGPIVATNREYMGFASSGPDSSQIQTTIEQTFTIQPGVTEIPLKFDYNFVTEEYPEWVNTIYNDNMRIVLQTPSGGEIQLAYEDINTSTFSFVTGIDFPGGDTTVGETGWTSVSKVVDVTEGPGTYRIIVRDEGDGIYDSNVLIDNIRFK